jgi:predicted RNA-binding Zn-ribbon protein involved in translation (DUF1610 family)
MAPPLDAPPPPEDVVVAGAPVAPPPLPGAESDADHDRRAAGRTFPCQKCGADLTFDPRQQELACPFCGNMQPIALQDGAEVVEQDLESALNACANRRKEEQRLASGTQETTCTSCGGTVQFVGTLTATACPYCATPIELAGVHDSPDRLRVDGVLAFQVEGDAARKNLSGWIRSRWFLPSELARDGIHAAFVGVYLPFFTFDAFTANRYSGMRGEHYYVTVGSGKNQTTVQRTRWYPVAGEFRRFFDDRLESAGSGLPEKQMDALEPWPLKGLKSFAPEFLSGFLARTYDLPLEKCFGSARRHMEGEIESEVRERIGGDEQRVLSIDTQWSALTYKHVLLPVWMASYTWRSKPYRVVVNAATGEVQGERPWSGAKIAGFVLLMAALATTIFLVVQSASG